MPANPREYAVERNRKTNTHSLATIVKLEEESITCVSLGVNESPLDHVVVIEDAAGALLDTTNIRRLWNADRSDEMVSTI